SARSTWPTTISRGSPGRSSTSGPRAREREVVEGMPVRLASIPGDPSVRLAVRRDHVSDGLDQLSHACRVQDSHVGPLVTDTSFASKVFRGRFYFLIGSARKIPARPSASLA